MDKDLLIETLSSHLDEIGQMSHWTSHYYEESDELSLQDTLNNVEDRLRDALKALKQVRKKL